MSAFSSESTFSGAQKNSQLGTKGDLRTWLSSMKSMTYTKYTTLATDKKLEIMNEYKKKKAQPNRSTVFVTETKETPNVIV